MANERYIVYTEAEGNIAVVNLSDRYIAKFKTEKEMLEAWKEAYLPEGAQNVTLCNKADIPTDRSNRDNWVQDISPSPRVIDTRM